MWDETGLVSFPSLNLVFDSVRKGTGLSQRISVALLVLTTITVVLRMYVRICMLKLFGWEDYLMVAAYLFLIALLSVALAIAQKSYAAMNGDSAAMEFTLHIGVRIFAAFFALTMLAFKLSLGIFFVKLFAHHRWRRVLIIVLTVLSSVTSIVYLCIGAGTCAQFMRSPFNQNACKIQGVATVVFIMHSVISFTGDYILTFIALHAVLHMPIPLSTRIAACLVLVLGTLGAIASTYRLVLLLEPYTDVLQGIRQFARVGNITVAEAGICVMAANLAMLRPLLAALVERLSTQASTLRSFSLRSRPDATQHAGPYLSTAAGTIAVDDRGILGGKESGAGEKSTVLAIRVDEGTGGSIASDGQKGHDFV